MFLIKQVEGGCQEARLVAPQRRGEGRAQARAEPGPVGVGGVGGAEDEVGAIAAEERLDSREGLHQVGAVVVSVVEHNNQVPGIRHCFTVEKCLQIFLQKSYSKKPWNGQASPNMQ